MPSTPTAVVASPSHENPSPSAGFILNGIAHRRSTRLMSGSSATRPSYLTTGIQGITAAPEVVGGTPSKLARKGSTTPNDEKVLLSEANKTEALSRRATSISVELPPIPADKQAEYAAVSPAVMTPERKPTKTLHPLKSFKEINENSTGVSTPQPRDVSEEALEYVLRESPNWLNNITQIDPDANRLDASVVTRRKTSSASAARVRKLRAANNKNDDLAVPEQQSSEPVEHPAKPVPLPVTPVFPERTGVRSSQHAPSSKKRKRDSMSHEDVPLPLELPVSPPIKLPLRIRRVNEPVRLIMGYGLPRALKSRTGRRIRSTNPKSIPNNAQTRKNKNRRVLWSNLLLLLSLPEIWTTRTWRRATTTTTTMCCPPRKRKLDRQRN